MMRKWTLRLFVQSTGKQNQNDGGNHGEGWSRIVDWFERMREKKWIRGHCLWPLLYSERFHKCQPDGRAPQMLKFISFSILWWHYGKHLRAHSLNNRYATQTHTHSNTTQIEFTIFFPCVCVLFSPLCRPLSSMCVCVCRVQLSVSSFVLYSFFPYFFRFGYAIITIIIIAIIFFCCCFVRW